MKIEFSTYLSKIELPEVHKERVEKAYDFYTKFLGYNLDDIFVSDYIDNEGARTFENLWFFNDQHCFEAKSFCTTEDYDVLMIFRNVAYLVIKQTDYDFINAKANDKSRINFAYYSLNNSNLRGEMKASNQNCNQLRTIIQKFFIPNFKNVIR